jgi:hypothetical protein
VAADLDRLVEELEALPREQKLRLVERLQRDGFFDDGDQSWYWTPEWQKAEKEADEDIAAGRVHTFDNIDDAISFLHREAGDMESE